MNRLAIITTHPIQYYAPLFRKLTWNGKVQIQVFYTWGMDSVSKYDPGFGKQISWDIPLLEGYPYVFVNNTSSDPGSHHSNGIICPTLIDEIVRFGPDAILVYGWNFQAHRRVMRYFKGKVPIWFRGDSTLLDYDYQSVRDLLHAYFPKFFPSSLSRPDSPIENRHSKTENRKSSISPLLSYLKFRLRKHYLCQVYKDIDKALYVGTHNKAYFLAHGLQERQLVYMPHAVDNHFFNSHQEEREQEALAWRRSLGIPDKDWVVLFAGKLEPKKNPEMLLNAIIELNEDNNLQSASKQKKQFHLILVGNGILEDRLKELSRNKPYIHFLPFQNQSRMPVVYRMGNLFCLPSQGPGETWGLAVNEAIACKRKVLVTHKVGCSVDLIIPGETGEIIASGNKDELKEGIRALCQIEVTNNSLYVTLMDRFSIDNQASIAETLLT